jgi:hypothetical protein
MSSFPAQSRHGDERGDRHRFDAPHLARTLDQPVVKPKRLLRQPDADSLLNVEVVRL